MRDMGYDFETALADIVDNSLAANANLIKIISPPRYPPQLCILDNGEGMSQDEITEAFKLAVKAPEVARKKMDLGRFGLGMKTASWSQCRRLTLASSRNGVKSAATLDLDSIKEKGKWILDVLDDNEMESLLGFEELGHNGTLIVWDKMDRVEQGSEAETKSHLAGLLSDAANHLELVFHRFLELEQGYLKAKILINENELKPSNPFFAKHPATQQTSIETIPISGKGNVTIQAFTLPHHNKVTRAEWDQMARKEGHLKNQGFYLYRERRLILWGTWFRLVRQQDLFKLARVKIDIPNTMDEDWQINIMKSSARPPKAIAERLRGLVDTLGAPSKRVYKNRGVAIDNQEFTLWQKIKAQGTISYRINAAHPVIKSLESELNSSQKKQFSYALEVIAAGLPVDSLYSDIGSSPERIELAKMNECDVRLAVEKILPTLKDVYEDIDAILEIMKLTEPYRSNFGLVENLVRGCVDVEK